MAIETTYVPGIRPGMLRTEHRVDGDSPFRSYPTEQAAEEREAEIAAAQPGPQGPIATA